MAVPGVAERVGRHIAKPLSAVKAFSCFNVTFKIKVIY